MSGSARNPWVLRPRLPAATPTSIAARVIAFPHAGGGATSFRALGQALPPSIELCAVQLPGREARLGEAPLVGARTIAGAALIGLGELLVSAPVVLLGHSAGALVAYEVARSLARSGRPARLLVASAHRAPDQPPSETATFGLSDDDFLAAVGRYGGLPEELLANRELVELVLPSLRADFETDHRYAHDPSLGGARCPILAIHGEGDRSVTLPEIAAWAPYATGGFSRVEVPGGHFPHIDVAGARRVADVLVRAIALESAVRA